MRTRKDIAMLMEHIFKEAQSTREAGQREYAHNDGNALQNFDDEAANFGIPRTVVWGIFAGKHWRGIRSYINGHRSQREDIRGRILDLIVYLILLWSMVDDEEEGSQYGMAAEPAPLTPTGEAIKEAVAILQGIR